MAKRLEFRSPKISMGKSEESCEQRLAEAIRARDELLKEKPSLRAYQAEIDRALKNVIGHEERMAVLGMMMEAKLRELGDAFSQLAAATGKSRLALRRLDAECEEERRRCLDA